ncbi:MAG: type IV toxin-antitoxin system AbiEi family antitoxin domain-containing protein [Solirubrobacterales bacterium]
MGDKVLYISDVDHDALYRQAESQAGYFTAQQAVDAGMDRSTLRHHARPGGRFERVRRGLYRLRHFPTSPHEHVAAAWLPLRDSGAVVSHESALELHDLSDAIPDTVHVTVPRSERGLRRRDGVQLHTAHRPPTKKEVQTVAGLPVTDPARSIVDSLETGAQPEQIEMAIHQALDRGLMTPRRLRAAAKSRPERVRRFVARTLEKVPA